MPGESAVSLPLLACGCGASTKAADLDVGERGLIVRSLLTGEGEEEAEECSDITAAPAGTWWLLRVRGGDGEGCVC